MSTPGFILGLREKIGNDLLWLPGVTAVVLNENSHVLLVRRSDNGRWTLITGFLEPGEQPAAGAAREVLEETGISVRVNRILRVESMPPSTYPNGDRVQSLDIAFLCEAGRATPFVNDDESIDVGWFDVGQLPELSTRELACVARAFEDSQDTWFDRAGLPT